MVRRTSPPLQTDAILKVIEERQVRVVYQPVVDLATRKTFAYEALVRPTTNAFDNPPSMFAAAVAKGCTGELGRLIRELAIAACPDFPLFLNIHPAELNERYLVQPNDPIFNHEKDVYLEITEAVPLSHFRLCQSILSEVRGRGVYLVVDDLGAGYSNLKYIADLHPRVVKLDRGLIAGLARDTRMFKLVSAIVVLCQELDALVVAEGIETVEELGAVCDAGATFGQGYLLARPAFPPPAAVWPEELRARARLTRRSLRRRR
ncbi:MAG: EAL domain-containing protein [Deltaproteobacteria bacterium]|nr:EAL domain-containing protein [Deltaproteobacteria bacterium]MCW5804250.1 EAL domain-containing protein [Deltaproteobacteria bacterium]